MEGLREEVEDLLWSAQVVEDHMMRQDMERLDQLQDRQSLAILVSSFINWLCFLLMYHLCFSIPIHCDFQSSK